MNRTRYNGLTLVEVIVCVAIVLLLAALLLPAIRRVGSASHKMLCGSNIRQLVTAFHNYHGDYHEFPKGCLVRGTSPEDRLSWMVSLLPYIEADKVFKAFDSELGFASNEQGAKCKLATFLCLKDSGLKDHEAVTHYVAISGTSLDAAAKPAIATGNGFMGYDRITTFKTIVDGHSETIALLETHQALGPWARGGLSTLRGYDAEKMQLDAKFPPFGGHLKGMNAGFVDGSVRLIHYSIHPKTLAELITIAGKEKIILIDSDID